MLTRLNVRDNEKPDAARKRFDGQLGVRAWATPGSETRETDPAEAGTPWWWNKAEADQSADMFMEMARAKGMIV
ncbi:MAG TPA: hypothetical protein VGA66_05545 [Mycobacterium sp.]